MKTEKNSLDGKHVEILEYCLTSLKTQNIFSKDTQANFLFLEISADLSTFVQTIS